MLKTLKYQITGVAPLLLHNGQTADPLNEWSKRLKHVSSKRAKTDADYEELSRIEWYASLYATGGKVCLPGEVLEACLVEAARKKKLGKQALAGMFIENSAKLHFDGDDLSIDDLWKRDENRFTKTVKVQRNKVPRTRFRVDEWSASFEIVYNDEVLNEEQIDDFLDIAGGMIGVGDWRPKFGRFSPARMSS